MRSPADGRGRPAAGEPPMDRLTPMVITHRWVLRAALPLVLSNMTVPLHGAVDTGVVGQIGSGAPIGAVGSAASF